jgi:hypothetical protein
MNPKLARAQAVGMTWMNPKPKALKPKLARAQAVGMAWLFGSWAACYSMEPCKQMTRIASTSTITDAVEKAERRIQKWSASLSNVPGLRSADRCVSWCFSSFCATVFVPVVVHAP